jgi:hypothetical protein
MATTAITFHETHGAPPRLYHVTFSLGDERLVDVTCDGAHRQFRFSGRGYRPMRRADRLALIEKFIESEAHDQPLERLNAELLHPGRQASPFHPKGEVACACHDDRQLPAGDRV